MTIHVEETLDSRSLMDGSESNQKRIELEFACWDDTRPEVDVNPVNIEAAVLAVCLAAPYGDPLYGLRIQTISLKSVTKSIFMATVPYGIFEPPKLNQVRFGFSTSGGSEKITHSLATIAAYASTGNTASITDHHNAILVGKDGAIQGTNRLVPQLSFRVTGYFDPADWDAAQWLLLNDLSGTWNLSTWHGWPAKTLLFEFAECSEVVLGAGDMVPVTFHFKARREEAVAKGFGISFTKDPWDHVWDEVALKPRQTNQKIGSSIKATYREQIYAGSDFTLLGLGS